jgi:hypothetical protein
MIDNADNIRWRIKTVFPQIEYRNLIIIIQNSQACRLFPKYEKIWVDTINSLKAKIFLLQYLKWEADFVFFQIRHFCDMIVK